MGQFTRDELEEAFAAYQQAAATAGATADWAAWADQFTEDAVYVEHHYGRFDGREAIRAWITETMGTFPGNLMPEFPIDWYVVDEDKEDVYNPAHFADMVRGWKAAKDAVDAGVSSA
jgi:hypothetical protein